jgi:hypothetical protein
MIDYDLLLADVGLSSKSKTQYTGHLRKLAAQPKPLSLHAVITTSPDTLLPPDLSQQTRRSYCMAVMALVKRLSPEDTVAVLRDNPDAINAWKTSCVGVGGKKTGGSKRGEYDKDGEDGVNGRVTWEEVVAKRDELGKKGSDTRAKMAHLLLSFLTYLLPPMRTSELGSMRLVVARPAKSLTSTPTPTTPQSPSLSVQDAVVGGPPYREFVVTMRPKRGTIKVVRDGRINNETPTQTKNKADKADEVVLPKPLFEVVNDSLTSGSNREWMFADRPLSENTFNQTALRSLRAAFGKSVTVNDIRRAGTKKKTDLSNA